MAKENNTNKVVLELATPVDFDGTSETKIVTTTILSKYINELFGGGFKDYVGCTIKTGQDSMIGEAVTLDLYFAPNSDNGKGNISAFCAAGTDVKHQQQTTAKTNVLSACLSHNRMITTTSSMVVTADAVSALYGLILNGLKSRLKENSKSFSDCGVAVETAINSQYGMNRPIVYNIIRGIDINAVMKVIFGNKENSYEYQVTPIKPVFTQVIGGVDTNAMGSKWIYSITQLDKSNLNDLMNDLGFYNKVSNFGIMVDTF